MKQTEQNTYNDEYSLLRVQDWEIDFGEDFIEQSCLANTQHDQQADQFCENNN